MRAVLEMWYLRTDDGVATVVDGTRCLSTMLGARLLLAKLAKKPFIALRFLPQAAYERAAALEVQPAPEVVTRVFMLFRGVSAEDAQQPMWQAARARVGEVDWVKVIGVKDDAWDAGRFRVLEWGAMEVL